MPTVCIYQSTKIQFVSVGDGRTFQAVLCSLQKGLRLVQEVLLWAVFDGMGQVSVSKVMLKKELGQWQ